MKTFVGSGFVMTLLFAGACGSRQSAATGGTAGDGAGGSGWTAGAGGGATGGSGGSATAGGLGGAAWLTPPTVPAALAVP